MTFTKTLKICGLLLFISTASGLTALYAQSKNMALKSFKSVSVSSGINLYLNQGNTETLSLSSTTGSIDDVEIVQDGDNLTIKFKTNIRSFKSRSVKANLTYKTLNALSASGGSDVFTENTLKATNFTIRSSGGSDLKLAIEANNLSIVMSGGSDIDLTGNAENFSVTASGGSDLDAKNLQSTNARVSASGGSDVYLSVSNSLDANASGGADIKYRGNPEVRKNNSKSGSVKRIN